MATGVFEKGGGNAEFLDYRRNLLEGLGGLTLRGSRRVQLSGRLPPPFRKVGRQQWRVGDLGQLDKQLLAATDDRQCFPEALEAAFLGSLFQQCPDDLFISFERFPERPVVFGPFRFRKLGVLDNTARVSEFRHSFVDSLRGTAGFEKHVSLFGQTFRDLIQVGNAQTGCEEHGSQVAATLRNGSTASDELLVIDAEPLAERGFVDPAQHRRQSCGIQRFDIVRRSESLRPAFAADGVKPLSSGGLQHGSDAQIGVRVQEVVAAVVGNVVEELPERCATRNSCPLRCGQTRCATRTARHRRPERRR